MSIASTSRWLLLTLGGALIVNAVASGKAQAQCEPQLNEISTMELVSVTVDGAPKTEDYAGYRFYDWQLVSTETGWTVQALELKRLEVEQVYTRE